MWLNFEGVRKSVEKTEKIAVIGKRLKQHKINVSQRHSEAERLERS